MSYASDALIDAQEREIEKLEAENADLRKRISQLEYERIMMFLELVGEWVRVKQREMETE